MQTMQTVIRPCHLLELESPRKLRMKTVLVTFGRPISRLAVEFGVSPLLNTIRIRRVNRILDGSVRCRRTARTRLCPIVETFVGKHILVLGKGDAFAKFVPRNDE